MRKFLVKRLLPFIASNVRPDIDTVVKGSDIYLRIRIAVFEFQLVDWLVPTPFNTKNDVSEKGMRESIVDVEGMDTIRDLPGTPKILLNKSLTDLK